MSQFQNRPASVRTAVFLPTRPFSQRPQRSPDCPLCLSGRKTDNDLQRLLKSALDERFQKKLAHRARVITKGPRIPALKGRASIAKGEALVTLSQQKSAGLKGRPSSTARPKRSYRTHSLPLTALGGEKDNPPPLTALPITV